MRSRSVVSVCGLVGVVAVGVLASLRWSVSPSVVAGSALLVAGAIFLPLVVDRSDRLQRRRYNLWRDGLMPQRNVVARSWKQLSIRGTLLLTMVTALAVASLQGDSPVGGFLLALGCVLAGIIIGLDYEPTGLRVMRGRVFSATIGGLLGSLVFAMFLVSVQLFIGRTWPDTVFWRSLGRLVAFWSFVGFFGGAAIGLWNANRPFRIAPAADRLGINKLHNVNATAIHERRLSSRFTQRWMVYLPAVLGSVLFHIAVVSLQAGLFDIGAHESSKQGKQTTEAIEIVMTMLEPDEQDEPTLNSLRIEDESDVASDLSKEASATLPSTRDIDGSETGGIVTDGRIANTAGSEAVLRESVVDGVEGAIGVSTDTSFEIPLNGQSVHFRSQRGGHSFANVTKLKVLADGKQVHVSVESPSATIVGYGLPLERMNVEFDMQSGNIAKLLSAKPFVSVSKLSDRPLTDGEARIQIVENSGDKSIPPFPRRTTLSDSAKVKGLLLANSGLSTKRQAVKGVMLDGRCPVHLIDRVSWKKGDSRWEYVHEGWLVRFHSAEAREKFLNDQERYLPVLNGLDVVEATEQMQATVGTRKYGVLYDDDGQGPNPSRIYLFSSLANRDKFEANSAKYVRLLRSLDTKQLRLENPSESTAATTEPIGRPVATRRDIAESDLAKDKNGVWKYEGPNLVKNGDFELPRVRGNRYGDAEFYATNNVAMKIEELEWSINYGALEHSNMPRGSSGSKSQTISVTGQSEMYQDLTTVPGRRYGIRFSYSIWARSKIVGTVQVIGERELLSKRLPSVRTRTEFHAFVDSFRADTTKTRITFRSPGDGFNRTMQLDDVEVFLISR